MEQREYLKKEFRLLNIRFIPSQTSSLIFDIGYNAEETAKTFEELGGI